MVQMNQKKMIDSIVEAAVFPDDTAISLATCVGKRPVQVEHGYF